MRIDLIQTAVNNFKTNLETTIKSARVGERTYLNGSKAKEALIRSSRLIDLLHEAVKSSLSESLLEKKIEHTMYPPVGRSSPELKISGFIKAKDQDVVALMLPVNSEIIETGPLSGLTDPIGRESSEKSIVIGVRSQLSSVDKNFDTLMERAFAETLNLRLRLNKLVMGELYLIPAYEYNETAMQQNLVDWNARPVKLEKFLKTFDAISGRTNYEKDLYKYERSCLLIVDFKPTVPKIYLTLDQLKEDGLVNDNCTIDYNKLSPLQFSEDLVNQYMIRHRS